MKASSPHHQLHLIKFQTLILLKNYFIKPPTFLRRNGVNGNFHFSTFKVLFLIRLLHSQYVNNSFDAAKITENIHILLSFDP